MRGEENDFPGYICGGEKVFQKLCTFYLETWEGENLSEW